MSSIKNLFEGPFPYRHIGQKTQEEKIIIVAFIKGFITEVYSDNFHFQEDVDVTELIQSRLPISYSEAETWFLEQEGKTIEQYTLEVRLNKVRELLVYTSFSVDTIAQKLNYPSVLAMLQELEQQTGLSLSHFLAIKVQKAMLALRQRLVALN